MRVLPQVRKAADDPAPERATDRHLAVVPDRRVMRPYTRFEREGLRRFQPTEAAFKPFRVF